MKTFIQEIPFSDQSIGKLGLRVEQIEASSALPLPT